MTKEEYCKTYPDRCAALTPKPVTTTYPTKEEYCRMYPEKCAALTPKPTSFQYQTGTTVSQEDYCKTYPEKCTATPKPTWGEPGYYLYPTTTNTGTVQGVSTQNRIVEIINFIFFGL
jgi:hypothetical protein